MQKTENKKTQALELTGMVFGELEVLGRSETPHNSGGIWWRCRCGCGALCEYSGTLLVTGRRKHCASKVHRHSRGKTDIQGIRMGNLTPLYPTEARDARGSVIWHCRCDCGKELDLSYNILMYTNQRSCGCRREANTASLRSHLTHVADTTVNSLKSQKLPKNNTTGHRGVYFIRGKYVAKINFQRKAYYLGAYDNIDDAIEARLDAQEQLFDTTASFYEKWQKKAEADPQWAEENPVKISVEQKEQAAFKVTLLPVMDN